MVDLRRIGQMVVGRWKADTPPRLTLLHWLVVLLIIRLLFFICLTVYSTLPEPLPPRNVEFSETRARIILKRITALGPRPCGSDAEIESRGVFVEELETIKATTNKLHQLKIETQSVSGCMNPQRCYVKVFNVLARLGPKSGSQNALLVNCHYDSVPAGPGASDDMVSCAVMMELLRILSLQNEPLEHDVIFLFNGAEETIWNGAHGFITQHPWRFDCRAVINLEANGAGGKEILFQSGPRNWMLNAYKAAATRPFASVLGQELFQHNLVPGGSDFVVFVETGNLTGIDMAFVRNNYVYHTEFDQERMITAGSLQREGENVLRVIRAALKAPEMAEKVNQVSKRKITDVYFDVLGMCMISYSTTFATVIQVLACLVVVIKIVWNIFDKTSYSIATFILSLVSHVISIVLMMLIGITLAHLVTFLGLTLTWYSNAWKLGLLYGVPSFAFGLGSYFLSNLVIGRRRAEHELSHEKAQLDSILFIYALIVAAGTVAGITATYIVFLLLVFLLLRDMIMGIIRVVISATSGSITYGATSADDDGEDLLARMGRFRLKRLHKDGEDAGEAAAALQTDADAGVRSPTAVLAGICDNINNAEQPPLVVLLAVHVLCSVLGLVMIVYAAVVLLDLFIPNQGTNRRNPEMALAGFCAVLAVFIVCTFSSLVRVSKAQTGICVGLLICTVVFYIVLLATSYGDPFVYDINAPRLRHLKLQHILLEEENSMGDITRSSSILNAYPRDYRPKSDLPPETKNLVGGSFPSHTMTFDVDSNFVHGPAKTSESLTKMVSIIKERRSNTTDWKWAITPDYYTSYYYQKIFEL